MQNEVTTDSEAGMKKASSSCSDKATNNGATTRGKTSRQTISRRTFLGAAAVMGVQVALFGLAGCAPQESGDAAEAYKPGTYTGKADGKFNTIEVEADFSETAIKDIRIINHEETRRIAAPAIEMIPQRIIEHQGLGVDTVTGATLTSLGIINATTDCVKQAGGSVSALQKRGSVEPTGEQIELEADAVVVGAGASGMGAALASAQSGARVIVLEKNSNIGGNCLVSGGYLEYLSAPDAARPEMTEELHRYVEEVLGSEIAAASDPAIVEKVRQQYEEYKATGSSKLFDSELFYSLDIAV
ncbi:MAG: FAD-dependent oxidoreductase, partial [Raoultibacter sp.]